MVAPASYLPGAWSVSRTLHDASLGDGTFAGTATFTPVDGGLTWAEHGRLRIGAYDGPARRTLHVCAEGGGWVVRFADGRLFHPLALGPAAAPVTHDCGADRYAGAYAVLAGDAFDVTWRVRGPEKDQRIETRYRRLTPR